MGHRRSRVSKTKPVLLGRISHVNCNDILWHTSTLSSRHQTRRSLRLQKVTTDLQDIQLEPVPSPSGDDLPREAQKRVHVLARSRYPSTRNSLPERLRRATRLRYFGFT